MASLAKRGLRGLTLACGAALALSGACSAPSKGAIMLSISTDMQTPKDFDVVSVFIATDGVAKFDYLGLMQPDGTLLLPSTLALVQPENPSAQVHIRVVAFQPQGSQETARVLRDVLTTVPEGRTALLRVPLDFLDDGSGQGALPPQYVPMGEDGAPEGVTAFDPSTIASGCDWSGKQETMVDGLCAPALVSASTLPTYAPAEVFGDAGVAESGEPASCFDVAHCFAGAVRITSLDLQACSFPLPQGATVSSLNVALVTSDTGACLASGGCYVPLADDPTSGWALQGSTVTLTPGICTKLGSAAVLAVSWDTCPPQSLSDPVCEPVDAGAAPAGEGGGVEGGAPVDATVDAEAGAGADAEAGVDATTACAPGLVPCGGACVDEQADPTHCGGCATVCGAAAPYCVSASCSATPASCAPGGVGMTNCGVATESCCASLDVPGGSYYRTYDDDNGTLAADGGPADLADPALVSDLRLDKYLVTVGRFRSFVNAVLPPAGGPGWSPPAGSGIHAHLNGGQGLVNAGASGDGAASYETGWDATDWNAEVAPTEANLACDATFATWTDAPGSQENLPINCVNWYEAYAFCIWDGAFLPSEAEWEFAAAGGGQQLAFPWGLIAPGATCPGSGCDYAVYNCDYPSGAGTCSGVASVAPVGSATLGAGLWGQLDLSGELYEWNLDAYAPYVDPCTDCANVTPSANRVLRGGSFSDTSTPLLPAYRDFGAPGNRGSNFGFRCARVPSSTASAGDAAATAE